MVMMKNVALFIMKVAHPCSRVYTHLSCIVTKIIVPKYIEGFIKMRFIKEITNPQLSSVLRKQVIPLEIWHQSTIFVMAIKIP